MSISAVIIIWAAVLLLYVLFMLFIHYQQGKDQEKQFKSEISLIAKEALCRMEMYDAQLKSKP